MKYSRKQFLDDLFRIAIVVVANVILSVATVWFLEPAHLYAGGATGLAQLIVRIINKCGGNFNLGLMIFLINVPIILIGWRFVSHRFALFSAVAILVQWIFTDYVFGAGPFEALSKDIETINGTMPNYGGILTLAIFGGLLAGFASGLALKFGTSTGGIDVLGQAFALHKGISIGMFTLVFNVLIAFVGGGWLQGSFIVTLFTCVRLILNSLVTDKVHTSYTYTALNIFTEKGDDIARDIMAKLNRGCTIFEGTGAYTHKEHTELYCVLSTYELDKAKAIVMHYDPKAFIVVAPVKTVRGNFIKKTIV